MTTSDKQKKANKKNAQKSTGPITLAGKSKVSVNAMKHGILSKKLILPHENRDEFDLLLSEMQTSLKPVGTMEQLLVEKITINLWRQCRLTNAESAQLSLQTLPDKISERIMLEQLGYRSNSTYKDSTDESTEGIDSYYKEIIDELEKLDIDNLQNWKKLKNSSPATYQSILFHAEAMHVSVDDFIKQNNGLSKYLKEIVKISKSEVKKIENNSSKDSLLSKIEEWVRAKNAVTQGELEKQLSRYQTSLDNELYKALKALREQQQWRRENIEGEIIN